ncbi:MAG: metal-dependent hydrolase [Pseudomonadota bacterium]
MFIGHYAPAAALKPLTPAAPLWHYFVAVQFLDYLWAIFILTGVEKAGVVPGFLEASDLDLYFMPYTHSLAAAALWSLVGALAYRLWINPRAGAASAVLIGLAIASHWLADLLVHTRDLALYPGSDVKLGLGLWSSLPISKGIELGFFLAGFVLYLSGTQAKGMIGRAAPFIVIAALIAVEIYSATGAPPGDIRVFAVLALVSYTAIAALAAWLDAVRTTRQR